MVKLAGHVANVFPWLAAAACGYFIASQLIDKQLTLNWDWSVIQWVGVSLALVAMPVNYYLEAKRWQSSVISRKIKVSEASQVVLKGMALNFIIPFTIGDAAMRTSSLPSWKDGAKALVKVRMIMFLITLIYGTSSLCYYLGYLRPAFVLLLFIWPAGVVYFLLSKDYTLSKPVVLSLMRYAVFTFQMLLLIVLWVPGIDFFTAFFGVGSIFFAKSMVPSWLGQIGAREVGAIIFFERFGLSIEYVAVPCLLIWFINGVLPALTGCYFLLRGKLHRT